MVAMITNMRLMLMVAMTNEDRIDRRTGDVQG